jgi:hypothetical protein
MATLLTYAAAPDVRGYNSLRVFDGKRKLDGNAAERHMARAKKALAKRKAKTA